MCWCAVKKLLTHSLTPEQHYTTSNLKGCHNSWLMFMGTTSVAMKHVDSPRNMSTLYITPGCFSLGTLYSMDNITFILWGVDFGWRCYKPSHPHTTKPVCRILESTLVMGVKMCDVTLNAFVRCEMLSVNIRMALSTKLFVLFACIGKSILQHNAHSGFCANNSWMWPCTLG